MAAPAPNIPPRPNARGFSRLFNYSADTDTWVPGQPVTSRGATFRQTSQQVRNAYNAVAINYSQNQAAMAGTRLPDVGPTVGTGFAPAPANFQGLIENLSDQWTDRIYKTNVYGTFAPSYRVSKPGVVQFNRAIPRNEVNVVRNLPVGAIARGQTAIIPGADANNYYYDLSGSNRPWADPNTANAYTFRTKRATLRNPEGSVYLHGTGPSKDLGFPGYRHHRYWVNAAFLQREAPAGGRMFIGSNDPNTSITLSNTITGMYALGMRVEATIIDRSVTSAWGRNWSTSLTFLNSYEAWRRNMQAKEFRSSLAKVRRGLVGPGRAENEGFGTPEGSPAAPPQMEL